MGTNPTIVKPGRWQHRGAPLDASRSEREERILSAIRQYGSFTLSSGGHYSRDDLVVRRLVAEGVIKIERTRVWGFIRRTRAVFA